MAPCSRQDTVQPHTMTRRLPAQLQGGGWESPPAPLRGPQTHRPAAGRADGRQRFRLASAKQSHPGHGHLFRGGRGCASALGGSSSGRAGEVWGEVGWLSLDYRKSSLHHLLDDVIASLEMHQQWGEAPTMGRSSDNKEKQQQWGW